MTVLRPERGTGTHGDGGAGALDTSFHAPPIADSGGGVAPDFDLSLRAGRNPASFTPAHGRPHGDVCLALRLGMIAIDRRSLAFTTRVSSILLAPRLAIAPSASPRLATAARDYPLRKSCGPLRRVSRGRFFLAGRDYRSGRTLVFALSALTTCRADFCRSIASDSVDLANSRLRRRPASPGPPATFSRASLSPGRRVLSSRRDGPRLATPPKIGESAG